MKAYRVHADEDWPHRYDVTARSKWGLPGIKCSDCGCRCWSFVRYPSLVLPDGVDPQPYLERGPVRPDRFKELCAQLTERWRQKVNLPPGADFGPLVGNAWGKCGDVCWAGSSMLLSAEAAERLKQAGVEGLNLVRTEIKWRARKGPEYLELDIPARARFYPGYLERLRLYDGAVRCKTCGFLRRRSRELPDRKARLAYEELSYYFVLNAPSLPATWDLLRIEEAETTVIASEHFRNAALQSGLTNIVFQEVAVQSLLLKS